MNWKLIILINENVSMLRPAKPFWGELIIIQLFINFTKSLEILDGV